MYFFLFFSFLFFFSLQMRKETAEKEKKESEKVRDKTTSRGDLKFLSIVQFLSWNKYVFLFFFKFRSTCSHVNEIQLWPLLLILIFCFCTQISSLWPNPLFQYWLYYQSLMFFLLYFQMNPNENTPARPNNWSGMSHCLWKPLLRP